VQLLGRSLSGLSIFQIQICIVKAHQHSFQRRHTFARVTAFDLQCPHCGTVDSVGPSRRPWKTHGTFNPVTSKWRCPSCRRILVIGVAAWRPQRTGNRQRGVARPADTIPTPVQLVELRGLVRPETRRRGDPVNLICNCLDRDDVDPACPFHGEEA
jgi:hypothetical protein